MPDTDPASSAQLLIVVPALIGPGRRSPRPRKPPRRPGRSGANPKPRQRPDTTCEEEMLVPWDGRQPHGRRRPDRPARSHRPAARRLDHRQPGGELSVEVRRPVEGAPGQERPLQIVAAGFDQSLGLPGPAACRPAPLTPGGRGSPGTRSSARTVRRGVGRPRARRPRPAPAAPHPATRVIATASEQVFRPPRRDQHTR